MLTLEQQKANRKLWVEALRSGKYRQTTGVLKDLAGGMCCLGVLCDVVGLAWTEGDDRNYVAGTTYSAVAPPEAMQFVGLTEETGAYRSGIDSLAVKNDKGATFAQIADIIESEPKGLFEESAR